VTKDGNKSNDFEVIYSENILSITKTVYQNVYSKLCIKTQSIMRGGKKSNKIADEAHFLA